MPKDKWTPPNDAVAARMKAVHDRYTRANAELEAVKADLGKLADEEVPIAALAELLGVQRKTIYRYIGREMS